MTTTHNALHQFSAGLNASNSAAPLVFDDATQAGWKVYYQGINEGIVRTTSTAYWEVNANTSGTVTAGDEHSLVLAGGGSADSGYSFYRDLADLVLTSAGKKFYLETRVKFTIAGGGTVPANAWFVGWSSKNEAFTTGTATAWDGGNDLLGFGKLDTETSVYLVSRDGGANQTIAIGGNLVSGTYAKFSCYYDGAYFHLYKDDAFVSTTAQTKLNADTPMVFQVMFEATEAKANTLDVQYALLAVEL